MYRLVQTCGACPEQYDVFLGEEQVGYLRLRHGLFRADYPKCGGETIFESRPKGDGSFFDEERMLHLQSAVLAIHKRHTNASTLRATTFTIESE